MPLYNAIVHSNSSSFIIIPAGGPAHFSIAIDIIYYRHSYAGGPAYSKNSHGRSVRPACRASHTQSAKYDTFKNVYV